MAFKIKKSYAGKIRSDQAKFIIPPTEENPNPTVIKKVVEGTTIGMEGAVHADRTTTASSSQKNTPKTGGMKIRKTTFSYSDG